jgi:hypothetical protein
VFGNRRIFALKRDEVRGGGYRKGSSEEPPNSCSSPHVLRVVKSRQMGHEAFMKKMRM